MHRRTLLATCLALAAGGSAWAQRPQEGTLKVGEAAPTFVLKDPEDKVSVDLAMNMGRPTVLIFGSCT